MLQVLWNGGARCADAVERLVPETPERTQQGETCSVRGRGAQRIRLRLLRSEEPLVEFSAEWLVSEASRWPKPREACRVRRARERAIRVQILRTSVSRYSLNGQRLVPETSQRPKPWQAQPGEVGRLQMNEAMRV